MSMTVEALPLAKKETHHESIGSNRSIASATHGRGRDHFYSQKLIGEDGRHFLVHNNIAVAH
jgi:hypothetical protein